MPGDFIPAGPYVSAVLDPSLALGETSSTAYRGDRGKTAYDHSQAPGNPHSTAVGDIPGLQAQLDSKAVAHEVRHDFVSPNDYMGTAPAGSATSASVWHITRLAVTSAGATTVTQASGVK